MKTLLTYLAQDCERAIHCAFPDLTPLECIADVTPCHLEGLGHYQCNSALRLSKLLKVSPRQIAEKISAHVSEAIRQQCSAIQIAGPGFLNFTFSAEALSQDAQQQLYDPLLGAIPPKERKKVIVEFSSPNVAKELHVGHIRSTIIGDCLARLFEFLGYDVLRLSHLGDWGTQFGMLIAYMKQHAASVLEGKEAADLQTLMEWYRAAKRLFDDDPQFKKRAQFEVVRLQSGESDALHAWELICDVSRKGWLEIYDLLGIQIVERGESFYNLMLKSVVEELESKGLVTLSHGAKCIFLEGFTNREGDPFPLMIQKSDGGYNYDTTDMAAIRHRIVEEKADRIIIVTDMGQSLHFQLIFKAAEKAGWLDPVKTRVDHVGFGLVLGADGKKFKTRSGETEKLIDLLTAAIDRAREIIVERLPLADKPQIEHLARAIGIGAIKYADLSSHRTKDYTFSYDRMLRFEGNTAVFLLYSYVRICGIKRKTHADIDSVMQKHRITLAHSSEIALALHLRRFGETLELMELDLLPNRLTDYLYELAERFNAFFRDCRVEGAPEEASRLLLCELTARVLKQGLELLGLQTVERM